MDREISEEDVNAFERAIAEIKRVAEARRRRGEDERSPVDSSVKHFGSRVWKPAWQVEFVTPSRELESGYTSRGHSFDYGELTVVGLDAHRDGKDLFIPAANIRFIYALPERP
jgi:hypothetical protein